MAEKRLYTLQIKYNDKTHWLAQRKYQSFNILSPMLLKKKKQQQRSNNLATGYTDQTLQTVLAFFNYPPLVK